MVYTGTVRTILVAGEDNVPKELIGQACKAAKLFNFIMSLPDGFDTIVVAEGTLLSGEA